jgi:hypothetical protein
MHSIHCIERIKYTESYLNYFLKIRYSEQHIIKDINDDNHNLVYLVAPPPNHIHFNPYNDEPLHTSPEKGTEP